MYFDGFFHPEGAVHSCPLLCCDGCKYVLFFFFFQSRIELLGSGVADNLLGVRAGDKGLAIANNALTACESFLFCLFALL